MKARWIFTISATVAVVLLEGCELPQQRASPLAAPQSAEPIAKTSRPARGSASKSEPDYSLLSATFDGNIEAVKHWLTEGANVNVKDTDYRGETPLQYATQQGHKEVAKFLIFNGADVNAKVFGNGETPLQYAAQEGHKEIAEQLIANGADVNAMCVHGTPLDGALEYGKTEIVKPLRKYGGKTSEELKVIDK